MDQLRMLIWIEEQRFHGFGCSECAWVFNPSGPPDGNSLEEMKMCFKRRRDKNFAIHACAEHSKAKNANGKLITAEQPPGPSLHKVFNIEQTA
jgi:hypothetical protein